jgi:hypothetical protein
MARSSDAEGLRASAGSARSSPRTIDTFEAEALLARRKHYMKKEFNT